MCSGSMKFLFQVDFNNLNMKLNKLRLIQGGFSWRKAYGWFFQIRRYRKTLILLTGATLGSFYYEIFTSYALLLERIYSASRNTFKPKIHQTYNQPLFV